MRRLLVGLVALCTFVPVGTAFAADKTPDDRIVVSGSVVVDRGETVPGDVVVGQGDVLIRGNVHGDVIVADGDVTLRGKVGGDVVTLGGTATLGRAARIKGDLVYFDNKPVIAKGAKVSGDTKKFDGGSVSDTLAKVAIGIWIAISVSMIVLGLLLLLLAPRAADAVGRTAKTKLGMSIGVGIAAFILLPIIAGGLSLTIVGTPLGIVLLLLLIPLFAISYVATGLAIGRAFLKDSRIPAFLLGILVLCLLTAVPFLGELVALLAVIFGLGLLFTTLFRVRSA
jgi:hypothetical protein